MTRPSTTHGRDPSGARAAPGPVTLGTSFPLVLLVVVASGVVAVAANGVQVLAQPGPSTGAWAIALRTLGIVMAGAGLAGLLRERRRLGVARAAKDPTASALRAAATIMLGVTALALVNPPDPVDDGSSDRGAFGLGGIPEVGGGGRRSGPTLPATTRGGDSQISGNALPGELEGETITVPGDGSGSAILRRAAGALRWLVYLLVAVLVLRVLSRRVRVVRVPRLEIPLDPDDAVAGLEASLAEVAEPTEAELPRGQIAQAYHTLLEALAAAGSGKEPQEAPHEHLYRALAPLGVHPEPLHRLAALYVLAQFSERPITDEHRAAAARALEASLVGLRAVRR